MYDSLFPPVLQAREDKYAGTTQVNAVLFQTELFSLKEALCSHQRCMENI